MPMLNSSADMLGLIAELNMRRISKVCGERARRLGGMMKLTPENIENLKLARSMHKRFVAGDFRHSEKEQGQIKSLCDWLVREHALNHNHPEKTVAMEDSSLRCMLPLPPESYLQVCGEVETW